MTNVFTSKSARIAAATPFATVAAASFVVAEATTKVAKKVAGKEGWDKTPFHKYVDAHATGAVFNFDFNTDLKKVEEKKEEGKADHSDMVEWKKGKWVPSAKATAQAKKNGYEAAFLPQMYKAANWLIRVAKEGGDKVYTAQNGEAHAYIGWAFKAIFGHAAFMEGKGVKNAKSAEKLAEYYGQACKHSRVAEDKLPTWEEVCAAVQAEQKLAKEEAAEERISVEEGKEILAEVEAEEQPVEVETGKKAEARDGRAPKTAAKYDIKALVRKAGALHLKADNAYEVAKKAKAAFEAKKLTDDEFQFVVNACIAKDGGDPEECYALMGEN